MDTPETKTLTQSKTVRFAALKPILLPVVFTLVNRGFDALGISLGDDAVQLAAEAAFTSVPFLLAEIWLRFKTIGPVALRK